MTTLVKLSNGFFSCFEDSRLQYNRGQTFFFLLFINNSFYVCLDSQFLSFGAWLDQKGPLSEPLYDPLNEKGGTKSSNTCTNEEFGWNTELSEKQNLCFVSLSLSTYINCKLDRLQLYGIALTDLGTKVVSLLV